jgi:protein-cysteine N-palmitoyltransferase HHAT
MTVITFFQQLYSLDTLDTRFTTSATTPLKFTNAQSAKTAESKDDGRPEGLASGASPSRYNTWEFYFYALVFLICVPLMYMAVVDVSQRMFTFLKNTKDIVLRMHGTASHPNYSKFEGLLSPGWLFGLKVVCLSLDSDFSIG